MKLLSFIAVIVLAVAEGMAYGNFPSFVMGMMAGIGVCLFALQNPSQGEVG